jgi:hypothetical protein
MRVSIFPQVKALPTKEEKAKQARFASSPYLPEIVNVNNEEDLINILTQNAWSPSIFNGTRSQGNFTSTDFMVLDIDSGMTIDEAESIVHKLNYTCLCLPSTSYTEEFHKFRLVFPLSKTIRDKDSFKATMSKLAEYFPADPACLGDTARFFFGGKMDNGFWFEADLMSPIALEKPKDKRERVFDPSKRVTVGEDTKEHVKALFGPDKQSIPESVDYWLRNAHTGLDGEWFHVCNSAIFTLGLMQVDFDVVASIFEEIAPMPLDSRDEYILTNAYEDGYNNSDSQLKEAL